MNRPAETVLVVADPVPPDLARSLDLGGYSWKAVCPADVDDSGTRWAGVIVDASIDADAAW